jgi:hypothetical protein
VQTEAGSEEVKNRKSCCNSFSATVDANVNDYLKVKMHLLK